MSLGKIKWIIAISQIGRIWVRNRTAVKVLQSMTALAFLALFYETDKKERESEENKHFNNTL